MQEASGVLGRLRGQIRLRGAIVLVLAVVCGALILLIDGGEYSDKAVVGGTACAIAAAWGLWRVTFLPRWLAKPEEIDRIDRVAPLDDELRQPMQLVMVDGQVYSVFVKRGERDELADALQQECNQRRLRARVVER